MMTPRLCAHCPLQLSSTKGPSEPRFLEAPGLTEAACAFFLIQNALGKDS